VVGPKALALSGKRQVATSHSHPAIGFSRAAQKPAPTVLQALTPAQPMPASR